MPPPGRTPRVMLLAAGATVVLTTSVAIHGLATGGPSSRPDATPAAAAASALPPAGNPPHAALAGRVAPPDGATGSSSSASSAPGTSAASTPPDVATPRQPVREHVAAAGPIAFRFDGPGFSARARVCHMADALALDPPGDPDTTVCWVRNNFGEKPGSASRTSYVLGHSYADDPDTALGRMSRLASGQLLRAPVVYRSGVPTRPITVLNGSTLTLWTTAGRLEYTVRYAYGVPKPQFGLVQDIVDESVPRRVLLVTCAVHGGRDLDYNVIVDAFLTSSDAR